MRTVGIIGGLGPESTIEYYRFILSRYRERNPGGGSPHIIIDSLDVDKGIALIEARRLDHLTDYLVAATERLARAGADFGLMAANTPHLVFNDLQGRSPIPLISIVRATAEHAHQRGLTTVGLFGTGFTMRANFYLEEFQRVGIALIRPTQVERDYIHSKYLGELLKNQFLPETRTKILAIADRMRDGNGVEAIVLAGTELPLLLRDSGSGIEFLDTTMIHVEAVVDELLR